MTTVGTDAHPFPTFDLTGAGAVVYAQDGDTASGVFKQVYCMTETEFASFTRSNSVGDISGVLFPAGTLLIGPVTEFSVTSGCVAAYS